MRLKLATKTAQNRHKDYLRISHGSCSTIIRYSMHGHMVDLQRHRATSGGRNFIEQIKAPIFLEAVLAKEII